MTIHRYVCDAKTDGQGVLRASEELDADSSYVLCRLEVPLPDTKFPSRQRVVSWILDCLLGNLRTLTTGMAIRANRAQGNTESSSLGGGNFLLAAGCCMVIEYLGQIHADGKTGTDRARSYVEEFLAPIDPRYGQYFRLIWNCLRNGIVHGSAPQAVCVRGDEGDRILVGASTGSDGEHFAAAPGFDTPTFVVNSEKFLADLEKSVRERFGPWILGPAPEDVLSRAAAVKWLVNPRDKEVVQMISAIRQWPENRRTV